jgi:hypothetical protein
LNLSETLRRLPDHYEVILKPKGGTVEYADTVANWLADDGKLHRLDDFDLVSELYLPERNGYPLPSDRRPYQHGDIGGHVDPPADTIYRGPIGEWLQAIEPETEATIPSLGAGLLAGLGAYMGRGIRLKVGRIYHTPNIFAVQVGPTGTARKGTADGEIQRFLEAVDRTFAYDNVASGFGSGEALIERVADPTYNIKDELIAGTEDQRLYIQEAEFSKVLRIADRQGSILSDVIRLAFDASRPLANAAKTSRKLKSSNHCISLFGGITPEELANIFPALAAVSGTGNRFLWVWSDSTKLLATGGREVNVTGYADRARSNINSRRGSGGILEFSPGGLDWWEAHYPTLRQGSNIPETVRPMVTRMSDQVQRIALIYTASEGATQVGEGQLEAGMAWVTHSVQTVQAVLGGLVRNEEAGRILAALRQHPGIPALKSEIHDLFSRHATATALDAALNELERAGLAFSWTAASSGGRPPVMVMATTPESNVERTYFARNAEKGEAETPKSSFAHTPQNGPNRQLLAEKSKSEKSPFEGLPPESHNPNAKEVSPDDRPDPW